MAREGAKTTADVEVANAKTISDRMAKEKEYEKDFNKFEIDRKKKHGEPGALSREDIKQGKQDLRDRFNAITDLKVKEQQAALSVTNTRSTAYLKAALEQQQQAKYAAGLEVQISNEKDAKQRKAYQQELDRAKKLSGGKKYDAAEEYRLGVKLAEQQERETKAPELGAQMPQVQAEKMIFQAGTEALFARASGDIKTAMHLEDFEKFANTFRQLQPTFGPEAAGMAQQRTQAEIAQEVAQSAGARAVSSMAAIGGGGNVSGVDPMLESSRRIENLNREMVGLLQILAGQEQPENVTPQFQP
jgi:hypothetical protein